MTYLEAISQADALAPNAIAQDQKIFWLREVEGLVRDNILFPRGGAPEEDRDLRSPLQAPPPWDGLYVHYLTMQIHFTHGEALRYNQAKVLYSALWNGFRDYHTRRSLSEDTQIHYF